MLIKNITVQFSDNPVRLVLAKLCFVLGLHKLGRRVVKWTVITSLLLLAGSPAFAQVIPVGPSGLNSGTISAPGGSSTPPSSGPGSGDVVGPASAANLSIPTYNGTTGKLISAGSGLTVPTSGTLNLSILNATGLITGVGFVSSGATNDITTGTNEDLILTPNGTGVVKIGSSSPVLSGLSNGILRFGNNGVLVGNALDAGATVAVGVFGDQIPLVNAALFTVYGEGLQAVSKQQAVTCVANAGAGGTLGGVTVAPTSSVAYVTNPDADGCIVTISEASAIIGSEVQFVIISNAGGVVTFPDVVNVHNGPAAAATGFGLDDSYRIHYADKADDMFEGVAFSDN